MHCRHTVLEHYLFRGREGSMLMCLGLGVFRSNVALALVSLLTGHRFPPYEPHRENRHCFAGSMFNHSSRPNVDYRVDVDRLVISFSTARDVAEGESVRGLPSRHESPPHISRHPCAVCHAT